MKDPEGLQFKLNTLNEEEASAQPDQPDEEEGAGLHAKAIQDPAEGAASASAAADEGAAGNLVKHVKKRRLYRQATGEEMPWLPHDNDPELLKELFLGGG